MNVGVVVYRSQDGSFEGWDYDSRLVDHLRTAGDTVTVIERSRRSYGRHLLDSFDPSLRRRLAGEFDLLIEDERCHPSLIGINREHDGIPIVSVVHHLRSSNSHGPLGNALYRRLERAYLSTVDAVLCPSTAAASTVTAVADIPTAVAHPGRDRFDPDIDAATIRERAQTVPFRVLCLGPVAPRANLDGLVDALASLSTPPQTTIVGDTTLAPAYTQRLRRRLDSIDGVIKLAGRLPPSILASLLSRAHVLAVPGAHEGVPGVVCDAMAFGVVPVAATASAGEFVTDGEDGRLVPPDDLDGLATTIDRLRTDRAHLDGLAVGARNRSEHHPTWTESMATARTFITEVVADHDPPGPTGGSPGGSPGGSAEG